MLYCTKYTRSVIDEGEGRGSAHLHIPYAPSHRTILRYKFRFPIENNVVGSQMDLYLALLLISQSMWSILQGSRTTPTQLVEQCILVCKKQVYKLLEAQADLDIENSRLRLTSAKKAAIEENTENTTAASRRGDSFFKCQSAEADLVEDEVNRDRTHYR